MSSTQRKAPIATNNQGGICKTSSREYRTDHATFHPDSALFVSKKPNEDKGVIYANG